jgi:hypothetical protein
MAKTPDSKPTRATIARTPADEARRKQSSTPSLATRILSDAPAELIDLHHHANDLGEAIIDDRVRPQSIAMLGRLISDQRMQEVWKALVTRSSERKLPNYGMAIFSVAQEALVLSVEPRRSPTTEKKIFDKTSVLIGELIRHIDEADMLGPCHVEEFMTDDEISELASLMHEPPPTPPYNISLAPAILGTGFCLTRVNTWAVIPALPELLRRWQYKLTARAPSQLWKQPENTNALRNLLALEISKHFEEEYGSPWDGHVTAFTNVALNVDEKDEEAIKEVDVQQLRRYRKLNSSSPKMDRQKEATQRPRGLGGSARRSRRRPAAPV